MLFFFFRHSQDRLKREKLLNSCITIDIRPHLHPRTRVAHGKLLGCTTLHQEGGVELYNVENVAVTSLVLLIYFLNILCHLDSK